MPTREQVQEVRHATGSYAAAAKVLAIPPGQAYLIATGIPADGSDGVRHDPIRQPGILRGSTQHLVYGHMPAHNPTSDPRVHHWLKGLVAADPVMRAAAGTRDVAPSALKHPDQDDIASAIARDHVQLDALFKVLQTIPDTRRGPSPVQRSQRETLLDVLIAALSRHEAAAQEHLWPAVRSHLADGDALAEHALVQDQQAKDLLVEIGRTDPGDASLDELVNKLETASYRHAAFEDRVLLKLTATLDLDESKALGASFRRAESNGPTRPLRHAPARPDRTVKEAGAAGAILEPVRDPVGEPLAERRGRPGEEPLEDRANQQINNHAPEEESS